jgi:hypothetical protein
MKHLRHTLIPLLLACAALGQNIDTLPAILGSAVDKANDKILIRDASVAAGAGALRSLELDELVNVPGLFSGVADSTFSIAKTSGLQAALGKIIYASTYGASPAATAAANVIAIQAALDAANAAGGGTVVLDGAGDYSVNATLTIGSKTRLYAYGAALKKTATYGEVLINRNAGTLTRDTDISIVGLTLKVNGQTDTSGANVAGMRGNLTFVKVDRLTVEDFQIPDMGTNLFGVHIHDWSDVSFTRCRFVGAKVGIQMGSGTRATIERCYFECHDDAIALLTREWVTIGTSIGDLTDVVVSNCIDAYRASQTGFFCRITSGAWAAWASGFSYGLGDTVVSAGKIYRMTNGGWGNAAQPAALIVSSVAPTHTSGSVTGADGIAWQYYRAGTDTESHVRRLTFRNNQYLGSRPAVLGCVWEGNSGSFDRSTSPGNVNLPEISGIIIDGGRQQSPSLAQTLIYGHANVTDIAIHNFHDANTGAVINLVPAIGFTSSTDPRAAHTTRVVMSNCRFAGTGNRDVNAQRQLLTLDISDIGSRFDSALGYLSQASSTGIIAIARSDVPWTIGVRIRPKSFNSTIQTLLGPYDALYGQWLNTQQASMLTYALDAKTTKAASGTAAVADFNDNGINVNAGTTATGSAYVRLLRGWSNDHSFDGTGGINFGKAWVVRMRGQGQAVSGAIRWYMAGPTAATLANANTFTAPGIGWELGLDGGEQAIRLVYHNGSPQASAWHKFGHAPARSRFYDIAIAFDGLQKIELYATSVNGNTAANPAPAAARITVTDGPTGSGSAGNSFCNIAAVTDGTTTPAANDIVFALRSAPILVFP